MNGILEIFEHSSMALLTDGQGLTFRHPTDQSMALGSLMQRARIIAFNWDSTFGRTSNDVYICLDDPCDCILAVVATAIGGRRPILGWKIQGILPDGALIFDKQCLAEISLPVPETSSCVQAAQSPLISVPGIAFHTSGSNGIGKLVDKNWDCLLLEALILKDLFQISSFDEFTSYVPPWHLYGFLHSFLVPLLGGAVVRFGLDLQTQMRGTVAIAVPSQWSLICRPFELGSEGPYPRLIVSSGAQLGEEKSQLITDLVSSRGSNTRCVEILGSTETGGMGYRDVNPRSGGVAPNASVFRCLPGVSFDFGSKIESSRENQGCVQLHSQFTFPQGVPQDLDDHVLLLPDGSFEHLGRVDRIFKYGGIRHSLAEVESKLASILDSKEVKCFFEMQPTNSKGGELTCYYVGEPLAVSAIRESFFMRFDSPFPSRFIRVESMGKDQMGKVTRISLDQNVAKL